MYTVSLQELMSFEDIYNKLQNQRLPVKASFALAKIYKVYLDNSQFYQDKFNEIIREYGQFEDDKPVLNETGTHIKLREGTEALVQSQLAELNNLPIELNDNIPLDSLTNLDLSPNEMLALAPFVMV